MAATAISSCPKCSAPRGEATACARCGLRADKVAAFSSQLDSTVPDVAHAAWERVKAQWEDTAAHDELLRLTTLHGCYAWAVSRYREVRGEAGPPFREIGDARDPVAARQLDRLRRAAEVALLTTGTPRPDKSPTSYQSARLVLGIAIVLILIGLAYALYQQMTVASEPPPPPRPVPAQPARPASQVR